MCVSVAVVVRLHKFCQSCRVKSIHTHRNYVQNACHGCTLAQLQFCNSCTYSFADTELAQTQAQTTETDSHTRARTHTHVHISISCFLTTPPCSSMRPWRRGGGQSVNSCSTYVCVCVLSLVLVFPLVWTKLVQTTRYSFVPFHVSHTQQ
jgi:L-asparagine transporter-like permease